jgi:glycosyltransferase involved in cell wall biosynthesis
MHAHGAGLAVSICICTYNRERLLRQTLSRLARLTVPEGVALEVVVVDNNSTDGTARVIQDAIASLPIRTVKELRPGIAPARNAAVAVARGELLLWIDDDVLVEPDWLERYARFALSHPEAAILGGPVRPHFEGAPPTWVVELLPEIRQAYALRDFPAGLQHIDADHFPYGANFATRRVLHQQIPFDPTLGRVGKSGGCLNEESAFFKDVLRLGYRGRWVGECPVLHVIPVERQTTRYLRQYHRLAGASPTHGRPQSAMLAGRPRWLWREWVQNELAFVLFRYTAPPSTWFGHLKRASYARGALFDRPRT